MAASWALEELLAEGGVKACCAALYESPAVRWFLGGELHPGGEEATRRSLELIELEPEERLLDVGSGAGSAALLAAREFGCVVAGLDYGADAVRGAQQAADAAGFCDRVGFVVGEAGALPPGGYERLLADGGLHTFAVEPLDAEAARLAMRLEDRLRAGKLLDRCRGSEWCPFGFEDAIAAVRSARRAIDEGALGYAIFAAAAG